MNILPRRAISTFKEFIGKKIKLFLPSVIPAHYKPSNYLFDWNSAVFSGPFYSTTSEKYAIEQQQDDRPYFAIHWKLNDPSLL
jgi:hypothetical protein